MTRQRQIILEEIQKMRSHPTADEVYERVRKRLPKLSLGTVYRNLEILSQSGVIKKLEMTGSRRRFDGSFGNHYHVACVHCGKVEDISMDPVRGLEESVRSASGYRILGHSLKFLGVCPRCVKLLPGPNSLARSTASTHPE